MTAATGAAVGGLSVLGGQFAAGAGGVVIAAVVLIALAAWHRTRPGSLPWLSTGIAAGTVLPAFGFVMVDIAMAAFLS